MTPDSPIKLVSELLDLPLYDSEEKYCGIVDDIELSGGPGKDLKLKALLLLRATVRVELVRAVCIQLSIKALHAALPVLLLLRDVRACGVDVGLILRQTTFTLLFSLVVATKHNSLSSFERMGISAVRHRASK